MKLEKSKFSGFEIIANPSNITGGQYMPSYGLKDVANTCADGSDITKVQTDTSTTDTTIHHSKTTYLGFDGRSMECFII